MAHHPNHNGFKSNIDALRADAKAWQHVALVTSRAAGAADILRLTDAELSWASQRTGFSTTYEQARAKVERLLGEATTNFNELGALLDQVAAAYQANDQAAAKRMKGVWEPR